MRASVVRARVSALRNEVVNIVPNIRDLLTDEKGMYVETRMLQAAEMLLQHIRVLVTEVEKETEETVVAISKEDVKEALRIVERAENREQLARVLTIRVRELQRKAEEARKGRGRKKGEESKKGRGSKQRRGQ